MASRQPGAVPPIADTGAPLRGIPLSLKRGLTKASTTPIRLCPQT
jgi:hypothetical protein